MKKTQELCLSKDTSKDGKIRSQTEESGFSDRMLIKALRELFQRRKTKPCHLLEASVEETDLVPTWEHFVCPKVYVEGSHLFRYLLKCKNCGQLFFYEFYEEIDWEKGNDPQYCTYIPVKDEQEAEELNEKSNWELLQVSPRLINDHHQDGSEITRWVR